MLKNLIFALLSCLLLYNCQKKIDYYSFPTFSNNNFPHAVIEIPAGTNKKFEYQNEEFIQDLENGKPRSIDFLPYLGNYGFIPSTYSNPENGGDGDAIDVLIISESVQQGEIIEFKPLGILKLLDDGEIDYKIIGVPLEKQDRIIKAENFSQLETNYKELKTIIESWFLNYNKKDEAIIQGWGNEEEALLEIKSSIK